MPKYRFEFREGDAIETVADIELADDVAAEREAVRTALEIMAEGVHMGIDRTGWSCSVHDNGRVVAQLSFADLLRRRAPLA